jgi:hypothetical protein
MKKILMALMFALAACGGGPETGAQAGAVRGVAVDTQNHPLSGAKIDICIGPVFEGCVEGNTAADGSYSLRLTSDYVWYAYGSITKSYNGATYCLPLDVDNPNSFSSPDGAVRNFTWKLSGVVAGQTGDNYPSSYYGATLNAVFDMSLNANRVRVNFVPNGPLIDGSSGSSFSQIAGNWASSAIGNIPIGVYTVRAEYLQPGGAVVPLRVSLTSTVTDLHPSVTVRFPPDPGHSCQIEPEASLYIGQ